MTGEISGHRYSWKMGTTGASVGVGLAAGTGFGVLIGVGAMAVEKGYDIFVNPNGPVQRNLNFNFSSFNIQQGFSMF